MTERVTGGCKCGLVRYEGTPLDAAPFRCHCRDCQQLTGSGHSDMMPLDRESFSIGAACQTFEMTGGSGQSTYSGFCPTCGSPLTRRSAMMSERVYVHAASLDDPGRYRPKMSIYGDAAQPWDRCAVIEE